MPTPHNIAVPPTATPLGYEHRPLCEIKKAIAFWQRPCNARTDRAKSRLPALQRELEQAQGGSVHH